MKRQKTSSISPPGHITLDPVKNKLIKGNADPLPIQHALEERIKEMTAFYGMSQLVGDLSLDEDVVLQQVANLLPPAMQFPEIAGACIRLGGKTFTAGHFSTNYPNQLVSPLQLSSGLTGELSVCYKDENPFILPEEQTLLDNLSGRLRIWLERKQADIKIRKLSQAIDQSPISIVITDINGTIEYVNPGFCNLTGYSSQEAYGKNPRILSSGMQSKEFYKALWNTILKGQVWKGEFTNRKKNGDLFIENASIAPIRDESGTITHFVAVKEDITQRKRDQARIDEALQFNQTILQAAPIGILIYNSKGDCISANKAAASIMETNRRSLLAENFHEIEPWKESGLYAMVTRTTETRTGDSGQFRQHTSRGRDIWIKVSLSIFQAGKEINLLLMFEDVTDHHITEEQLSLTNEKLVLLNKDLEVKKGDSENLREMMDLLQVCKNIPETFRVFEQYCERFFPGSSSAFFMVNEKNHLMELVSSCGENLTSEPIFHMDDCWCLRRSQLHFAQSDKAGMVCAHMQSKLSVCYVDIPMMVSGEVLGVLHIEWNDQIEIGSRIQELGQAVAENISMSISNIRLRQRLLEQSIHDPMTGAFNRRYLEETLSLELPRAIRKQRPLSLIMMDIDHFKNFNDTFGHTAGDFILTKLVETLYLHIRAEDVVCRMGGEEFLVLLPETTLEVARLKADLIRSKFAALKLVMNDLPLGQVTISLGVATYPDHGNTSQEILLKADQALYKAKEKGRNQVETA